MSIWTSFRLCRFFLVVYSISFSFLKALIRVGVDCRIVDLLGKTAENYLQTNCSAANLLRENGRGVWAAVESKDFDEIQRFVKGKSIRVAIIFLSCFLKILLKLMRNTMIKRRC